MIKLFSHFKEHSVLIIRHPIRTMDLRKHHSLRRRFKIPKTNIYSPGHLQVPCSRQDFIQTTERRALARYHNAYRVFGTF